MKVIKLFSVFLIAILTFIALPSCSSSDPEPDPVKPSVVPDFDHPLEKGKRTILVYAVASNSLSSFLNSDMMEMLDAAPSIDWDNYRLLIYRVQRDNDAKDKRTVPELMMIAKSKDGSYEFKQILKYTDGTPSTSPERITRVITDMTKLAPADEYGLILWSHSSAWFPSNEWQPSPRRYFGEDFDGSTRHYCDIPTLANAIPDGIFSFIWFDSCYMANIETAYQMRDKCDRFIGSVTELTAEGMPYDITLPILLGEKGDVVKTAKASFDHYNKINATITMSVYDMSKLDQLANATHDLYSEFQPLPSNSGLQIYSRIFDPGFYDFGQYSHLIAAQTGRNTSDFDAAVSDFVLYKAASKYDFRGQTIDQNNYSGISCHSYRMLDTRVEQLYRALDWYRRIYPASATPEEN